jgi:hypothetical protein
MPMLSDELIIQACKDLQARADNKGGWPDKKIPESVVMIKKSMNIGNHPSWPLTVESLVKTRAIKMVAERM